MCLVGFGVGGIPFLALLLLLPPSSTPLLPPPPPPPIQLPTYQTNPPPPLSSLQHEWLCRISPPVMDITGAQHPSYSCGSVWVWVMSSFMMRGVRDVVLRCGLEFGLEVDEEGEVEEEEFDEEVDLEEEEVEFDEEVFDEEVVFDMEEFDEEVDKEGEEEEKEEEKGCCIEPWFGRGGEG
ncbi:hypothetical protein C8J55DRAFT_487168 [Lentinula edodes]|uniref:Uncharacterized protein n=1 Tax=Lentinula lateritia TaxID=40482 RepID=A0A9W9AUY4_9AGAR|nr:hypothetical protein C8J55DRAFT_487168 [Lentinula edodes]